jgi:hypothetical protein
MFYCEPCRVDFAWPESVARSRGKCEVCGQHAACYDRPSGSLPDPAACETTSGCVYGRGHQRRGMEPCRVEERFVEPSQDPGVLDLLDLDGSRAKASVVEKGYDARSTTTAEGRTIQVTLSADFARQIAYSLTERIVAVGEQTNEGRWLSGFVADLVKVNP